MNNIEQKLWVQVYLEFISTLEKLVGALSSDEYLQISEYSITDMIDFLEVNQ